jgi:hypothetical protein
MEQLHGNGWYKWLAGINGMEITGMEMAGDIPYNCKITVTTPITQAEEVLPIPIP